MENRFKPGRTLWLALLLAATSVSMRAQLNSRAGHITIVAIMPENLSLSANHNGTAYSRQAASRPEIPGAVATEVTTTWSLMQGRAQVATFVTVSRPNVPNTRLNGSYLTDTNRRGASTAVLPDIEDPSPRRQLRVDTPAGTLKIQVQPVL